jgi:hypothetical protein
MAMKKGVATTLGIMAGLSAIATFAYFSYFDILTGGERGSPLARSAAALSLILLCSAPILLLAGGEMAGSSFSRCCLDPRRHLLLLACNHDDDVPARSLVPRRFARSRYPDGPVAHLGRRIRHDFHRLKSSTEC